MAQRVAVQEWMGAHEEPLVAAVEAAVVVAPILAVLALYRKNMFNNTQLLSSNFK